MPDVWTLAAIVAKFALYVGVLVAAGTVLAALVFRLDQYRRLAIGFAALGLCATILVFSLRGANLTGEPSGMVNLEMLGLLWSTPVGTAIALRLVGLVILIVGLFFGSFGLRVSALGGILAIWSFDHVGHVSGRDTTLLDIALTLHLVGVAFWIGILTPLKRMTSTAATYPIAAQVGHRFGQIASVVVPLLMLAGAYMGYVLVGTVAAFLGTGYGQTLIVKVALVAILLGLAAVNKVRFIPHLQAGDPRAARHLSQSITIEWVVILAILGATAVLTTNATLPT
ncbi:MAG: CopD family protein [Yoonia sp.]|nr:CopD family protein [Yoonia sp.]